MSRRAAVALLAVVCLCGPTAGCAGAAAADGGGAGRAVTVRDTDGELLARVPLPGTAFAVSYRNSIYHTLAEEQYRVHPDGAFGVVEVAADQLAVLEEYYAVPGPVHRAPADGRRTFSAEPAAHGVFDELSLAATELGERTLHVPGHPPVPLPPLVANDPTVVLDVEELS